MATTLQVGMDDREVQRGMTDLEKGLTNIEHQTEDTAKSFQKLNDQLAAEQLRVTANSLRSLEANYARVNSVVDQSTNAIVTQSNAMRENTSVAQGQTIVYNQQQSTMADVALRGLTMYSTYRLVNAAQTQGVPLWQKHNKAILGGGAALIGIASAGFGVVLALKAVTAAANAVVSAIAFMEKNGINNVERLTKANARLEESWNALLKSMLRIKFVDQLIETTSHGLEDMAGTMRLMQEAWEGKGDPRTILHGVVATMHDGAQALGQFDVRWKLLAKSIEQTIAPSRYIVQLAVERQRAEAQLAAVEKSITSIREKNIDIDLVGSRKLLGSLDEINRAQNRNAEDMRRAADGTEAGEKKIQALQKVALDLLDQKRAKLAEIATYTQRIKDLETSRMDDFHRDSARELTDLKAIDKAQAAIVAGLKKARDEQRLGADELDYYTKLYQANEARRKELITERVAAETEYLRLSKAVSEINAKYMEDKEAKLVAAADAAAQRLRDAIAEAKGVDPNKGALDEARGSISQEATRKEIIRRRQEEAIAKRLEEGRGRGEIDQNNKAIGGDTARERAAAQRKLQYELDNLRRQISRDTYKEFNFGGKGDVKAIDEKETRAAQDSLLKQGVDSARAQGRLSVETAKAFNDVLKSQAEVMTQTIDNTAMIAELRKAMQSQTGDFNRQRTNANRAQMGGLQK